MQRRSTNSVLICRKPELAPFYRSDDRGRGETILAFIDCALLLIEIFRIDVVVHARKVIELSQCDSFHS